MEMTTISEEHIRLNVKTVNWLSEIKPILETNSANYESYKIEFEERLQKASNKLNDDLTQLVPFLSYFDSMDDLNNVSQYVEFIRKFVKKLYIFDEDKAWINKEESLFKFQISDFPLLDDLRNYIMPFYDLLFICYNWQRNYYTWMDGQFEYLNGPLIEKITEDNLKEITKMNKVYKNKIRQDILESKEIRFKGIVDDPHADNQPAPLKLCNALLEHLEKFRAHIPIVSALCNPDLKQRHWDEMSSIIGYDITPNAGTTLRKIIRLKFGHVLEQFEVISVGACKEQALYNNLQSMMREWKTINFSTSVYKDLDIQVLVDLDDVQAILEDHLTKTLSMRGSAFVKPFETRVRKWYDKLCRVNLSINEWGKVQLRWLYLLPIFYADTIIAQMPDEAILFKEVDNTYRKYMLIVNQDSRVIKTASLPGLLEELKKCSELLETINNGVNLYLENKRLYFARFFFLSNAEMLEILSETKNPTLVQPSLQKCFEGIHSLKFDDNLCIISMSSFEGEEIPFANIISTEEAGGSVEKWLVQVEQQMQISLKQHVENCYYEKQSAEFDVWLKRWPQQITICVSQILWTISVHKCILEKNLMEMQSLQNKLLLDIDNLVKIVKNADVSKLMRLITKTLLIIKLHEKDILQNLINNQVFCDTDFQWLSQLRYYWNNGIEVKIMNVSVNYGCEYIGNSDRLVITPLTNRCFISLINAYYMNLCASLEGPAGSGKTETVKDLAKAIAVRCINFNCSNSYNYKTMAKFIKGIVTSGAWGCFDEFNRIDVEVLSVIAEHISYIIKASHASSQKVIFQGLQLKLHPMRFISTTMNPDYVLRSELPDNLKILFRTVSMVIPDFNVIGEIHLLSSGFVDARNISFKITLLCKICAEQLSIQHQYDFGLQTLINILRTCQIAKINFPTEDENSLVLKAINNIKIPKILQCDIYLYETIIKDLFPEKSFETQNHSILVKGLIDTSHKMELKCPDFLISKILSIYECLLIRHGFILLGKAFSGKTSALKILADTLTKLSSDYSTYNTTSYEFINSKAITMNQLFGTFINQTDEWIDGIISKTLRMFREEDNFTRQWMIFDGPLDALWAENLNSVLDDNRRLCLTSGEVMILPSLISIIFEVSDLSHASPATISRCGVVYLEDDILEWHSLIDSWITHCNPVWRTDNEEMIRVLLDWVIPPCINFVKKYCTQTISVSELNMVRTTINLFEMFLNEACRENDSDEINKFTRSWFQASLVTSLCWSFTGILDYNSKVRFDEFYKDIWRGSDESNPIPTLLEKVDIAIPGEGMLLDYWYLYKMKGCWKSWFELIKSCKPDDSLGILPLLIPTVDSARYTNLLEMHIKYKKPMLLIGPSATGKSFYMQSYLLNKIDETRYEPDLLRFTSQTTANQTQELIISKLQKKMRGVYGPMKGKTCVLFIDDLHLPTANSYGAQPPIELLRQYLDHKYWYDLKDCNKILVDDILMLSTITVQEKCMPAVTERLLHHFFIYSINEYSEENLHKIFSVTLLNNLKKNGFPSDIIAQVTMIVTGTLEIYKSAIQELLPSPSKLHYILNFRDISKVITGCSLMRKESAENRKVFTKLWVHEIMRVFGDRLINKDDGNWLVDKIQLCIQEQFKEKLNVLLESYIDDKGEVTFKTLHNFMFSTAMDADSPEGERKYEEVINIDAFINAATSGLNLYNDSNMHKLDIVLFPYALENLSKVCRLLSMSNGNGLLVAAAGYGRQTLAKLATSMLRFNMEQPRITTNYNTVHWRNDLKRVLKESGALGNDVVFLITESDIKQESFIQDIDCLLKSGDIPNMYNMDEKQQILELVRLAAQGGNRNLDINPLQIFSFFMNRVKAKLHIILCFSPLTSTFRKRIRRYPSLTNFCTINWMQDWPKESLSLLANKFLSEVNIEEQVKNKIITVSSQFHDSAENISKLFFINNSTQNYITYGSYLCFLKVFSSLYKTKQIEIIASKHRFNLGLLKLKKACETVKDMNAELLELEPQLISLAEKSKEILKQIEIETIQAERATDLVRKDESMANVQAAKAQDLKRECEADLALAIPILEEALRALNTLKPADIVLVKSMKNPPDTVKLVMAAVCVIKGIPPDRIPDPSTGKKILDYWGPSKKLLGEMTFLQQLKDFDKDNIPEIYMDKIRKEYLPNKVFKPEVVAKASSAAEGLCKWIIAMDLYDEVAKVVGPKKAKLEQAEKDFAATMSILNEKRALACHLDEKVAVLNALLDESNTKKQKLQDDVEQCTKRLAKAEKLISCLSGDHARWCTVVNNLQEKIDTLVGDMFLSAGIIAYLAPLTLWYRNKCITSWISYCLEFEISCSKSYTLTDALGSNIEIQNWYVNNLPVDSFLTDNAIIQKFSMRCSLFIDPQKQALKWLKSMEKENKLVILNSLQQGYIETITKCIEDGRPVLIQNIEELEPALDSLLINSIFKHKDKEYICFDNATIKYNNKFRLYLTTNLNKPLYSVEIFNKVTVINFALTEEGLEDQLLKTVISRETPAVQEKSIKLSEDITRYKALLKEIEDNMLKILSESQGDILENEKAIELLYAFKLNSDEILEKQKLHEVAQIDVDECRMNYRPIAKHAKELFFCIKDLSNLNSIYQFSLKWFINLFLISIKISNRSKILEERLKYLHETLTYKLYYAISRSLFENDKIIFSFVLCAKLKLSRKEIDPDEYNFFINRKLQRPETASEQNIISDWLSDESWRNLCELDSLPKFNGIKSSFCTDLNWKQISQEEILSDKFPSPWNSCLNGFEKMIITSIMHPDKVTDAVANFVEKDMGSKFVEVPLFNIITCYNESNYATPIIFVLTPGSNPVQGLMNFAKLKYMTHKLQCVSSGQGQNDLTYSILKKAQKDGNWVCIENCHLSPSLLLNLAMDFENLNTENTHLDYRVWLTSAPSSNFPVSLLQDGIKVIDGPPNGIKAKLYKYFHSTIIKDNTFFNGCPGKDKSFTKLMYASCFFHGILQERRNIGILGWNIPYEFNESDLQISLQQLQILINKYERLPFQLISYVIGEYNLVNYINLCLFF